jgi:poly(3-hydroxybutyrate) depolymerase
MKKHVICTGILAFALLLTALAPNVQALTPGSGTWVKETATYGTPDLQDAYVYVPANPTPAVKAGKRALMLSMHGCSQTASGNVINKDFNWEATAEQYGMVVVAPTVPSGTSSTRVVSGCWDWFGSAHSRVNRDGVPLKALLDAIIARSNLDIDPNQIYVTGLSSGAGETHVIGCMLPDYFAGMGLNAAPALGSASGDISIDPKVTPSQIARLCQQISGSRYTSYYNTQITSVVYGDSDHLVKPTHDTANVNGMKIVYGANANAGTQTVTDGSSGSGVVQLWSDANGKTRVSDMKVAGMGHAWPSGPGGAANIPFDDNKRINYPAYVTKFFFDNNLRVVVVAAPTNLTAGNATDNSLELNWSAVTGASSYNVYRNGTKVGSPAVTSYTDSGLQSGSTYNYTVKAVAANGVEGDGALTQGTTTGSAPILPAPSKLTGTANSATTVILSWSVVTGAQSYNVYRNNTKVGNSTGTGYTDSGLTKQTTYSYTVSAVNSAGVEGSKSSAVSVTTPAAILYSQSVTDTVVNHYVAGRLSLTDYLGMGAKLGYTAKVTLYMCGSTWTNQSNCGPLRLLIASRHAKS